MIQGRRMVFSVEADSGEPLPWHGSVARARSVPSDSAAQQSVSRMNSSIAGAACLSSRLSARMIE